MEKGIYMSVNVGQTIRPEDLVCFSHLRWGFVFQRPQHLMSRFAKHRRVFFIEEAILEDRAEPEMRMHVCKASGVIVATPLLPKETTEVTKTVAQLVRRFFRDKKIQDFVAWYYTPMALDYSGGLKPKAVVYDCMDELSLFRNAPPELGRNERKLFQLADLVFTGGISLFEAKQKQHNRVYPFPSSVDCAHFRQARTLRDTAEDQKNIPRPRLGYAGVIDERIDIELVGAIAERRPDWQIVMVGPVVKIDPAALPKSPNIHWLGMKNYDDLPLYFAGWDVALMPFALNDSTRYISPTKTPEYLAAGLPVVSTAIRDVERQYGKLGLVSIEGTVAGFCSAIEEALTYDMGMRWRERADAFLRTLSWDRTWHLMNQLIEQVIAPGLPDKVAAPATAASEISVLGV
jgi:UDP-galactopyranose mutase